MRIASVGLSLAVFVASGSAFMLVSPSAASAMGIDDKKFGNANDIKMTIEAPGDLERMNAQMQQRGNVIQVIIVQGGKTPAKTVAIAEGTCANVGKTSYTLQPFTGGEYQAQAKGLHLDRLQDGKHVLVVFGSNGTKRTNYACGEINKPNPFIH